MKRLARLAECAVLFGVLPGLLDLQAMGGGFLPLLLLVTAVMLAVLLRDPTFDRASLGRAAALRAELPRLLLLALPVAAVLVGLTVFLDAQPQTPPQVTLLAMPRYSLSLWLMVMILYPLLSVFPQEVVFRVWFFHRYTAALGGRWPAVFVGGILFGWAHVLIGSTVAILLSIPAGWLLGWTFTRSRSLLASAAEHALYGNLVFTAGLGWLFYAGSR